MHIFVVAVVVAVVEGMEEEGHVAMLTPPRFEATGAVIGFN